MIEQLPAQGAFQENRITVNDRKSSSALWQTCSLHYTLPTPDGIRLANARPIIKFIAYKGAAASTLFSGDDTQFGSLSCPGFQYRGRTLDNGKITYTLQGDEDALRDVSKTALTLSWTDILSTASEGFCSVKVTHNLLGTGDVSETHRLYKRLAQTEISHFEAMPSSGYPGQPITLKWKVSNARSGYILPGGYDIFQADLANASSKEVTLQRGVDSYFLYASGASYGVYREAKVYLPPPSMILRMNGSTAEWNCFAAERCAQALDGQYTAAERNGSCALPSAATTFALRCEGGDMAEEEIWHLCREPELTHFSLRIHTYQRHKVIEVLWDTVDAEAVSLKIWDTASYPVSSAKVGHWEQAYDRATRVSVALILDRKGGKPRLTLKL